MSGYDWNAGKSNNAVDAEDRGLLKKSQLSAWQKRAIDVGAVSAKEWHHTSKFFNKTNYYDPADFDSLDPHDFPPAQAKKAAAEKFVDFVIAAEEFQGVKPDSVLYAAYFETAKKSGGWFLDDYQKYGSSATRRRAVFTADQACHDAALIVRTRMELREYAESPAGKLAAERARICKETGFVCRSMSGKYYRSIAEKDDFEGHRDRLVFLNDETAEYRIETT